MSCFVGFVGFRQGLCSLHNLLLSHGFSLRLSLPPNLLPHLIRLTFTFLEVLALGSRFKEGVYYQSSKQYNFPVSGAEIAWESVAAI